MKLPSRWTRIFALISWTMAANVSGEPPAPISFEFHDQHREVMVLQPVFERPMIVTVADKKGSEQLIDWIKPLTQEFGTSVDFFAIADLRAVPGPLKGLVRRSFRKQFEYDVAMDWDGNAARTLSTKPDTANLILLNQDGLPVVSVHGPATEKKLAQMVTAIQTDLKHRKSSVAVMADDGQQE